MIRRNRGHAISRGDTRPAAGLAITEWINRLTNSTEDVLRSIVERPGRGGPKVIAAGIMLRARQGSGRDIDLIFDRTLGKPRQEMAIEQVPQLSAREHAERTIELLRTGLAGSGN